MRLFIAIEVPLSLRNSLSKIQDKLKISLPLAILIKPPNLHLTLDFLGEISPDQVLSISQGIDEITEKTLPFEIKLESLGVFPDYRSPRVIWIGPRHQPERLKQLVKRLRIGLSTILRPVKLPPFHAHISLSRIKERASPQDLKGSLLKIQESELKNPLNFKAKGITLFQSSLGPKGPTYTILKKSKFLRNVLNG